MRAVVRMAVVIALATAGCAVQHSWPERRDISIEPAARPAKDLMICIVDAHGDARCHHRAGVLAGHVDADAGIATCPGADVPLRSPCRSGEGCLFPSVPVPAGGFGLLVVELRPLLLGLPRHVVVDTAVVSDGAAGAREVDVPRMSAALDALARCVAPTPVAETAAADLLRVERSACEHRFCGLRRTRLKLAAREGAVVGVPRAGGLAMREESE